MCVILGYIILGKVVGYFKTRTRLDNALCEDIVGRVRLFLALRLVW